MSTYTKDLNDIYFLNDKNIVQDLHGTAIPDVNAIPSLSLLQDSYDVLSGYTNTLSVSLSNTLSAIKEALENTDKDTLLSVNGISAKINQICADISAKADMIELSVNGLSNAVEEKFVHKAGDDIAYLNVLGQLSVKDTTEIDGNVRIHGSLVQGESVKATNKGGIALGISAEAMHTNSFVWNGNDNIENYLSHGSHGTFNVNPEQGTKGFYIGEETLSDIIKNDVKIVYDDLSSQIYNISGTICANVDTRRTQDKAELSNVLSTYSNELCTSLSNTIESRRKYDKYELSNVLSTYSNELCTSLSNTVISSGYAKYDLTEFYYETNLSTHLIWLKMKDILGRTSELSIDTTDFIKDRILKKAEVCYNEDTPPLLVLRLYWNNTEPSVGEYTDIKIKDLAKIYKAGDGISITEDLSIYVNDTIARVAKLNNVSSDVITLSTTTIPAIEDNVSRIQTYINELSNDSSSKPGIICQLSNAINNNSTDIQSISSSFKAISTDIISDISSISNDVNIVKNFDNMLCSMTKTRSGIEAIGVIPDIKYDISALSAEMRSVTNFGGTIELCKYNPRWIEAGYGNELSSILKYNNIAIDNKIKNGNLYKVIFTSEIYNFNNTTFAADQVLSTSDGFNLHHKDWLYIATGDNKAFVELSLLTKSNVHHIPAILFNEYNLLSNIIRANYPWLAGNNTRDAVYEISVGTNGNVPIIISAEGHSFGSNNDFEGNNRFYGTNYFLCAETDFNSISCRGNISADGTISSNTAIIVANRNVVADNAGLSIGNMLSVTKKVDLLTSNIVIDNNGIKSNYDLTANADIYVTNISVGGVLSVDKDAVINALTAETLSAGTISADWSKVINPSNGYNLFRLSVDLSNKIWIDDQVNHEIPNHTSDLSIIKIKKDDFDLKVGSGTDVMSANTLYIVDSDYIDAYGQAISNVIMSANNIPEIAKFASEATNKNYVDYLCANLSIEIEKLSTALSNDIKNLSADLSSEVQKLSTALSNEIDTLSTSLSNEIGNVRTVFKNLYNKIDTITVDSKISDIISVVVELKNAISNLTAY